VSAARIYGHGAFETNVFAVDLFREKNHISVFRNGDGLNVKVFQILSCSHTAAYAVLGIYCKAHAVFTVDLCDAGVVNAHDFLVLHSEAGFGFDLPMNTVIGESESEIGSLESLLVVVTDIVTENHNVFAVFTLQYARIEGKSGFVGNVVAGKNGFGISRDAGFCFEKGFINRFERSWHFDSPPKFYYIVYFDFQKRLQTNYGAFENPIS
jgi:hypothetical protein